MRPQRFRQSIPALGRWQVLDPGLPHEFDAKEIFFSRLTYHHCERRKSITELD